jgi:hypothetical protein
MRRRTAQNNTQKKYICLNVYIFLQDMRSMPRKSCRSFFFAIPFISLLQFLWDWWVTMPLCFLYRNAGENFCECWTSIWTGQKKSTVCTYICMAVLYLHMFSILHNNMRTFVLGLSILEKIGLTVHVLRLICSYKYKIYVCWSETAGLSSSRAITAYKIDLFVVPF